MIVFRTCLVIAQVGVLGATLHGQSAPALSSTERAGQSLFQTRCAMCHVGQEPASEMARENPRRRPATMGPLLSKANTSNEAALIRKIKDGSRLMPGYKHTLSDEQISQVVAFMKTIDEPMTRIYKAQPGRQRSE